MSKTLRVIIGLLIIISAILLVTVVPRTSAQITPLPPNPQSGSIGVQGTISSPPPSQGATITVPVNGQTFTNLPITVSGLCPNGLLVKLFKNNVFAGSTMCTNNSFSIQTDLFSGQNELVARVYDELDQAGPDSNTVVVTFNDARPGAGTRPTLTSNFAKRGVNPGQTLTWPISISGGEGPYAISVDWGDGKAPDLLSQPFPGNFTIEHIYDNPGVYNIIIKATDKNGASAFLQVVGIANGPLSQTDASQNTGDQEQETKTQVKILWQPAAILIPFILSTFWLGKKYELHTLRKKIERGDRPF